MRKYYCLIAEADAADAQILTPARRVEVLEALRSYIGPVTKRGLPKRKPLNEHAGFKHRGLGKARVLAGGGRGKDSVKEGHCMGWTVKKDHLIRDEAGQAFGILTAGNIGEKALAVNARKLAAAPEMLEFIERVAADGHESDCRLQYGRSLCRCICVEAAALVAKAKGEVLGG